MYRHHTEMPSQNDEMTTLRAKDPSQNAVHLSHLFILHIYKPSQTRPITPYLNLFLNMIAIPPR